MTVEELYKQIDGDYAGALGRMQTEQFVARLIVMFLEDSACEDLIAAWAEGDEGAAFRAAHTTKGVCVNLALSELADVSSQITEALRPGNDDLRASTDVDALVKQFEAQYRKTEQAIKAFAAEQ